MTQPFTTSGLTFQGTGKITPAAANVRLTTGAVTFAEDTANPSDPANPLVFSGFKTTVNSTSGNGGVVNTTGNIAISGGANTFTGNSSNYYGGVFYNPTNINVTISGGINAFTDNTAASHGGAIHTGHAIIKGGENEFSGNSTPVRGGAIYSYNTTTISNGTNLFSGNSASEGGAIFSLGIGTGTTGIATTINGGTNTFTGNKATTYGGAINSSGTLNITGGTNEFTNNTARATSGGGAIYATGNTTLRASDGNITFQGNRDGVQADGTGGKANAMHYTGNNLTLAAEKGQSLNFYDPITSVSAGSGGRRIDINPNSTDTGAVVFDGSDYAGMAENNRRSDIYGNTYVGYGELALKGDVTLGNIGTFMLRAPATLASDAGTNRIQAGQNVMTMNGDVYVSNSGILELTAGVVNFNGNLNIGLGTDSFGSLDFITTTTSGKLNFGKDAKINLFWEDDFAMKDNWNYTYNLTDFVSATGGTTGLSSSLFDLTAFDDYGGFTYKWNDTFDSLTLSYSDPNVAPEPATLAIIGLGLAGLGLARRRK